MTPYIEIGEFGKVQKRFPLHFIESSIDLELMSVPSIEILLEEEMIPYLRGRKEIHIHIGKRIFFGHTSGIQFNNLEGTIEITINHIVTEWNYRQVPTNYAVKNQSISQAYQDERLKYSDEWIMNFDEKAQEEIVDYVYSRQNKLEALSTTVELTQSLWWRVNLNEERLIEVGKLGEHKPYRLSTRPSGDHNIRIIDINFEDDFSNVINLATVYSNKSDNGMSSMSLREVYNDKSLQNEDFPVIILREGINNERDYNYIEYPKLAPNNDLEYSVIDTKSVAMESGIFLEGTFAFDDLSPFSLESDKYDETPIGNGSWNPQEFIDMYNGQSIDMDGVPSGQIYQYVDVFKKILEIIGFPNPSAPIGGDGYAYNIWTRRVENGYAPYFDFYTSNPRFGDVVVWSMGGDTPYSHVAMYVGDGQYFGQNQPYPYCNVTSVGGSNILGYMRVKEEYWKGEYNAESSNGVQTISDEDRIYASKVAYDRTIKKLINARRKFSINVTTEELPLDLNVGDCVKLNYDLERFHIEECGNYLNKLIHMDDWWYITKMSINIDSNGLETGELTLEKFLRIDREGNKE